MSHDGGDFVTPKQASAVRKGTYCMLKDHPCKVVDMSTSKTGKHGHAKVKMTGICVLTDKKYQELFSSTHNAMCPTVTKVELQVTDISEDGTISCMDEEFNEVMCNMPTEEELPGLKEKFDETERDIIITLLKAPLENVMVERVVAFKESNE